MRIFIIEGDGLRNGGISMHGFTKVKMACISKDLETLEIFTDNTIAVRSSSCK
jgi:hypothetical protein